MCLHSAHHNLHHHLTTRCEIKHTLTWWYGCNRAYSAIAVTLIAWLRATTRAVPPDIDKYKQEKGHIVENTTITTISG